MLTEAILEQRQCDPERRAHADVVARQLRRCLLAEAILDRGSGEVASERTIVQGSFVWTQPLHPREEDPGCARAHPKQLANGHPGHCHQDQLDRGTFILDRDQYREPANFLLLSASTRFTSRLPSRPPTSLPGPRQLSQPLLTEIGLSTRTVVFLSLGRTQMRSRSLRGQLNTDRRRPCTIRDLSILTWRTSTTTTTRPSRAASELIPPSSHHLHVAYVLYPSRLPVMYDKTPLLLCLTCFVSSHAARL
jgi:hypothetical protein